jgi:hypothetical protein
MRAGGAGLKAPALTAPKAPRQARRRSRNAAMKPPPTRGSSPSWPYMRFISKQHPNASFADTGNCIDRGASPLVGECCSCAILVVLCRGILMGGQDPRSPTTACRCAGLSAPGEMSSAGGQARSALARRGPSREGAPADRRARAAYCPGARESGVTSLRASQSY